MDDHALTTNTPFVGRQASIQYLFQALGRLEQGSGYLVLISGEAGIGKTALVDTFISQASTYQPELVVLSGQCSFQIGATEPYSPFRTMMDQLLMTVNAATPVAKRQRRLNPRYLAEKTARAIYELAPDLIGTLIPLGGVAMRSIQILLRESGVIKEESALKQPYREIPEQIRIFDQYCALLSVVAAEYRLILVIDDLHWADEQSLNLLSYLTRKLAKLPLLIVGTYRPTELTKHQESHQHPLLKIEHETLRYRLGQRITLDLFELASVQGYIDQMYTPNVFPADFAQWILNRTAGNALFMTETLRQMLSRGDIVQHAGVWHLVARVAGANDLPESVEAVIRERIGRLEDHLLDTLTCASVEGEEFTAEVIAQVRNLAVYQAVRALSNDLERQHFLVRESGEQRIAPQRMLSTFQFRHNVFREYIYAQHLGRAERRLLHQQVGEALEHLYGNQHELIAATLAHHFRAALNSERAIPYLLLAADALASVRAFPEAVRSFTEAGELLGPKLITLLRNNATDISAETEPGSAAARSHMRMFALHYIAYVCANPQQRMLSLRSLMSAELERHFRITNSATDELYRQIVRLMVFLSELAISRQDQTLYADIVFINYLLIDYLENRNNKLAAAFRYSYLTWVAESLEVPHREVAQQAARQYIGLANQARLQRDMKQAFDAMEAAAFNFWRAMSYLEAGRIYYHMLELLPQIPNKEHGLLAYGWLGARNCAWAIEHQALSPSEHAEAIQKAIKLFIAVADELATGNAVSLGAAHMYRKALMLIAPEAPERDEIQARLDTLEARNRVVQQQPTLRRAAIVAESYDAEASVENALGDRLVSNLLEHGIACEPVLPTSIEELYRLPERYDLIVMQSGPRSPRPQGQYVREIFGDSREFERLYLSRQHFYGIWEKLRFRGADWILFAGNDVLLTVEAATEFVRSGRVQRLLPAIDGRMGHQTRGDP